MTRTLERERGADPGHGTVGRPEVERELVLAGAGVLLALAATAAVDAVFIGRGWLPLTWSAIVLSGAVAASVRRLRFGVVAAAVASLAVWAVFTYVTQLEFSGLVPGREQLDRLLELWSQGVTDIVQEPAPARPLPTLIAITASGAWWMTHLIHELLVRARRPGFALVAGSLFWLAPLAAPQPASRTWPQAIPFLAAGALLLLLEPDTDVAGWRRATVRPTWPSRAGLSLGAVAIVTAVALPGIVPGYGTEPIVDLTGAGSARGYQPIVDVSRRLKLPETRNLLRVEAPRPLYLRLAGLDTFDGGTWRLGAPDERSFSPDEVLPADRPLPPEVTISRAEPLDVTIENLSLENVFVPVPYTPVEIRGDAARRMVYSQDGTFIATSDVTEGEPALVPGLQYDVEAAVPVASPEELRGVSTAAYDDPRYARWLELPGDYPRLAETADAIVDGARNPYDAALALQQYFRDPDLFRYSTDVPALRDSDAITRFVTEEQHRVGYCEYFSTAMAIMLRLEGIPSRVAVGFRTGDEVAPGEYIVTTDDAHAWVEVLFPGFGWIQFEPTPALRDTLVPSDEEATPHTPIGRTDRGADPEERPSDTIDENELLRQQREDDRSGDERPVTGQASSGQSSPGGSRLPWIAAALLGLAGGGAALNSRRRNRHHPEFDDPRRVLAAQHRVHRAARDHGVGRRRSETAVEVADRWAAEGRVPASDARRLAELSQAAAFGGWLDPGSGAEADELGDVLVEGLRASVPRRDRLAAPVRGPLEATERVTRRVVHRVARR